MNEIINEANRCLKCKRPLCKEGCPVRTPVPEVMQLFLEGEIIKAGEMLFSNNPLSVVCSLICPHEKNCLGHCVLNKKGTPISFFSVENYISSFYLEKFDSKTIEKNGLNVGIIGTGPAGLTLAIILAKRGFNITLFDSRDKIGGVLRYGIPDFRLPKTILDKLLGLMKSLGIVFRPNTLVGQTITLDDMLNDGYDAIFIGTGVWKPNSLRIKGESLGHVHYAIDYLKNPAVYDLGKEVLVIGAGNVAMDASRTILRQNHSNVNVIFFRGEDQVTASNHELQLAKVDGVKMRYFLNTVEIQTDGIIVEPVIEKVLEDGSKQYINDSDNAYKIPCDNVIIAIGQGPLENITKTTKDLEASKKGLIETKGYGITTKSGVFAAGDIVTGPKTVVEAVAYTKGVAVQIEKYCYEKYNMPLREDLKKQIEYFESLKIQ